MTIPSGDDAPPEDAHAAPPPEAPRPNDPDGTGDGPGGPWTAAETTAAPKPPQAWFAPPQIPPSPGPREEEPAADRGDPAGRLVHACLIGAAAVVLVSVFLPWASWNITVVRGAGYFGIPDVAGGERVVYGMNGNDGLIVVLAGMAALALAVAAHAVSAGFAPYAAIPGCLALIAVFHQGITLGDDDATAARSISWGYWVAVVAALAVVAFGLAAAARVRPQS